MTATTPVTLGTETWVVLHSGGGNVLVQLRTPSGAAEIVVKEGSAPTGVGPHGAVLDKTMPAISMVETGVDDIVYGIGLFGEVTVVVMA